MRAAAAVASALLLAAAYPPRSESESAWFAFIPLLFVARYSAPARAWRWGFLSGLIFWLITLAWLLRLCAFGGPPPLVFLGWVLLSAYCALYTGTFALLVSWLWRGFSMSDPESGPDTEGPAESPASVPARLGTLAAVPLLWIGLEWIRANLLGGFPWNGLGISQFLSPAFIQIAEWGGVYAVSGLIMLVNAALAATGFSLVRELTPPRRRTRFHAEFAAGLLAVALCWGYGSRRLESVAPAPEATAEARIGAIQPNIPQNEKWTQAFVDGILDRLSEQTGLLSDRLDLIVWPETALPGSVRLEPELRDFVGELAREKGVPILVGSLDAGRAAAPEPGDAGATGPAREQVPQPGADNGELRRYNASVLVNAEGEIVQVYRKRHLVPFGEFVPLDKIFPILGRFVPIGFSCTAGQESTVFDLPLAQHPERRPAPGTAPPAVDRLRFAALICFEDVFPYLARDAVRAGARLLVSQTNDAWFDGSYGPVQHVAHSVFRCVENRVPLARSANSGVTCFIDRGGRLEYEDVLTETGWQLRVPRVQSSSVRVHGPDMPLTAYARYGDWTLGVPCAALTAVAFALWLSAARRRKLELRAQTGDS